jgi:hypothetical protein
MDGGPGGAGEMGRGMGGGAMGGGPGGRGGMHGGGMGVVTKASSSSLTIEPLMGREDSVTVKLGDDVEVYERGNDGPGDIESATVSDIDEGDIVAVRPNRDEAREESDASDDDTKTIEASEIIILHNGE